MDTETPAPESKSGETTGMSLEKLMEKLEVIDTNIISKFEGLQLEFQAMREEMCKMIQNQLERLDPANKKVFVVLASRPRARNIHFPDDLTLENGKLKIGYAKTKKQLHRNSCVRRAEELLKKEAAASGK